MLAAAAAPAIVRADSLMRVVPMDTKILDVTCTLEEFDYLRGVASASVGGVSEMITRVMIERAPILRENINRTNLLLHRMRERGLIVLE